MDFIRLVAKTIEKACCRQLLNQFDALVKESRGIVPVTIVTATELDSATKEGILAKVKGSVKGELEVTEEIDESLIGGFLVKMGDIQIDATIANQFNNLKQRLTR